MVLALEQLHKDPGPKALDLLLGSPSSEVRRRCAWTLGQIKTEECISRLAKLAKDDDESVRLAAVKAMRDTGLIDRITEMG